MSDWEHAIIDGFNVTFRFHDNEVQVTNIAAHLDLVSAESPPEPTVDIHNITVPARTSVGDLEIALKKKYPQLKGLSLFGVDFETVLTEIIFDQLWAEKARREEEAGARKRPLPSQKAE